MIETPRMVMESLPIQPRRRRMARLDVGAEIIAAMCKATRHPHLYVVEENPIPDDAHVIGAFYDSVRRVFTLGLESSEFEEVEEGVEPPELEPPIFREVVCRPDEG